MLMSMNGRSTAFPGKPFIWCAMCVHRRSQPFPASGALYIVAYPPESDSSFVLPFAERVDTLQLPDGWTITFDRLLQENLDLSRITPLKITGEKWLSLLGYELEQVDNRIILTTYWQVENLTPEIVSKTFAPFVHVFDEKRRTHSHYRR